MSVYWGSLFRFVSAQRTENKSEKVINDVFVLSLLCFNTIHLFSYFLFQAQKRPSLLGYSHFYSTLAPPSGNIHLLHPLLLCKKIHAWRDDLWCKEMISPSTCCRRVSEVQVWPFGSGGPVALQEREVSVLPPAHADECRRPDRRPAQRRPRSLNFNILQGWDLCFTSAMYQPDHILTGLVSRA